MSQAYHDPVAQLLSMGDVRGMREWSDYPALGLTAEHVPELARMALDEELHWADGESAEVWAPLHAWRALGQLRATAAVEALLNLLDRVDAYDDDWMGEELPDVFGMIGPAALPGLRDFLAGAGHGLWAQVAASESLAKIAQQAPAYRDQVVAIVTEQLRHYAKQDRTLNAFLVDALAVELKAQESALVIEEAYARKRVDLSVLGDWEEAQIYMGLLDRRLSPAPHFLMAEWGSSPASAPLVSAKSGKHKPDKRKQQAKAKRKQAKASRRLNRKR
jgi:hypothetical protein